MIKRTLYISLLVLAACKSQPDKQENKAQPAKVADETTVSLSQEQYQNAGVVTGRLEIRSVHATLRVNGTVEVPPENVHTISFPMGGYIKNTKLIPGMPLQKGALLATLEDQAFIQLQQDYLTAKAKLNFVKADHERQEQLNKSQSNSQRVLQQAAADYESQRVLVKALGEKLRLIGINPDKLTEGNLSRTIAIYSPITGYVSKVNVNPGKYVSPADALFELIDASELHIDLNVFEQDAAGLKPGMKVNCFTNNNPGQKYPAVIEYVAQNLDENRAVEVHCHLVKAVKGLLPGNFITGEIQLNNQQVNTLPDDGVIKWQGKTYVFATTDKKTFRLLPAETGAVTDGYTEIKTRLPESELVIKNAYALLSMLKNKSEE